MISAGKTRIQLSVQGRNSRKNTVAIDARLERNLESRERNLVTKGAHSGMKEFATGIQIEIAFLLLLFFLLGKLPPFLLDRKLSNFSTRVRTLPFQYLVIHLATILDKNTSEFIYGYSTGPLR